MSSCIFCDVCNKIYKSSSDTSTLLNVIYSLHNVIYFHINITEL